MKTHREYHEEQMKKFGYRFWWYLYWPYFKIILPLLMKATRRLREVDDETKIICLCGSSRFVDIMAVVAWLLEKDEGAIAMGLHLLPHWYPDVPAHHLAEAEGVAEQMDELHLRKIDLADEVFVIDWHGYIGESTAKEIEYATAQNKPIRYLRQESIYLDFVKRSLLLSHIPEQA